MNFSQNSLNKGLENVVYKIIEPISKEKESKSFFDSIKKGATTIAIIASLVLPTLKAADINNNRISQTTMVSNYVKNNNTLLKDYNLNIEIKENLFKMFNKVLPFDKYETKDNNVYILDFINKVSNTNFKTANDYFNNITIEQQKLAADKFKDDLTKNGHPEYFDKMNVVFEELGKNTYFDKCSFDNETSLTNKDKHVSLFLPNVSEISKSVLWEFANDMIQSHKDFKQFSFEISKDMKIITMK